MKVMATRQGFYCNTLIEEGWVFELLKDDDGKDPLRKDWVPILDEKGKDTGKGEWVLFKDADGKTRHRDFAPDEGETIIQEGPGRGEVVQIGWMEQVSDRTEVTIDLSQFRYGFNPESRKPYTSKPNNVKKRTPVKPLASNG